PSMILRPASPKLVPLGLRQALTEPGELDGAQKAAVLNHSSVVGLPKEMGEPVALARTEPLTPRVISKVLPRTRGVKYRPEARVKSPLHCQPLRMCESAPFCAKR